jgi:hypothetical protein
MLENCALRGTPVEKGAIMTTTVGRLSILATLCLFSGAVGLAQVDSAPRTYVLREGSTFQRGCFPPCLCPMMQEAPLTGTFTLDHVSSDPDWFDTYEVRDVKWVTQLGGQDVSIAGAGTYRIGGNFALRHRLEADLTVGEEPPEHYDSGTVVGGSEFPAIVIEISVHGQHCFDTVMNIRAKPTMTMTVDRSEIRWDSLPSAVGYDVVRGDLATLHDTGGDFREATTDCLADDRSTAAFPYDVSPEPGAGFWFEVRAWGDGIHTTYDSGYPAQLQSRDPGINASAVSCP